MKILFISSGLSFHHGGSAISEGSLCRELQNHGDVKVLTNKGRAEKKFTEEYGLKDVKEYSSFDLVEAFFNPSHWLRELFENVDVCHMNGHWKWPYYIFSKFCMKTATPYVIHPRGMMNVGYRSVLKKKLFNLLMGNSLIKNAATIIALSRYEKMQLDPYGIPDGKVAVIPNGVPILKNVKSIPPKLPNGVQKYFLYFGRLEARKNLLFLTEAFAEYRKAGGTATLLMVGPVERNYDWEVEKNINELNLEKKVFILPPVYHDQKIALLKNAIAVVYPTIEEPFGRVPFEAVAVESAPIIPEESGSAEYLKPFLPECIYKTQKRESLVSVMNHVEKNQESIHAKGLLKARVWMDLELNWASIGRRMLYLYETVSLKNSVARNERKFKVASGNGKSPLSGV